MRPPAGRSFAAGAVITALLACPAIGRATIPTGNQVVDGDAEAASSPATDATTHACPAGWSCSGNFTAIRYGAVDFFPSTADSDRIQGGNALFAGGPTTAGPPNSGNADASQGVDPTGMSSEIASGGVQVTLSGCLGGSQDSQDSASAILSYEPGPGGPVVIARIGPTTAADRGNATKLTPFATTARVPTNAIDRTMGLHVLTQYHDGTYNDAYADNLSLVFGPYPGPAPPAVTCSPPAQPSPAPSGTPAGGGNPSVPPSNSFSFGKATSRRDGSVDLVVNVPGPGTLSATGVRVGTVQAARRKKRKRKRASPIRPAHATATAAGPVTLHLKPTAAARKLFAKHKKVLVVVTVGYVPTGGSRATQTRLVTLAKKRRKH
jgi:hypothetical protein